MHAFFLQFSSSDGTYSKSSVGDINEVLKPFGKGSFNHLHTFTKTTLNKTHRALGGYMSVHTEKCRYMQDISLDAQLLMIGR